MPTFNVTYKVRKYWMIQFLYEKDALAAMDDLINFHKAKEVSMKPGTFSIPCVQSSNQPF